MRHLIWLPVLAVLAYMLWPESPHDWSVNGAEEYALQPPEQGDDTYTDEFKFNGYTMTPMADFVVNARVLSRKEYSNGRESELSPVDLALGWGDMTDPDVLSNIQIDQRNRFYTWRAEELPIPRRAIETQSANMHLIPANENIEDALDDVDRGDIIILSGQLVNIHADDGWRWISSLTRQDTGNGACEVVFVEDIQVLSL